MELDISKKKTLGNFDEGEIGEPKAAHEDTDPAVDLRRDKIGSPAFLPPDERASYDEIQNLRERFLRRLKAAWNEFKREYITTFDKQFTVTRDQRKLFKDLLDEFSEIAADSFSQGVRAGNRYYEDQFSAKGLTESQQRRVARQHAVVFKDRAKTLFFNDVSEQVNEAPPEDRLKILDSFDRFLLGYANVVGAIAYDVFARSITTLNKGLFAAFSRAGQIFPRDAVKVEWRLFDDAEHSSDCLTLAEGEDKDGSGLWDARVLSEMGLVPRSPNLDCGGNCKCHLSPIVPLAADTAKWLDRITSIPVQRDSLATSTNISQIRLQTLFQTKGFTIPSRLLDDIVRRPAFRRKQFFDLLPDGAVTYNVTQGSSFSVSGVTRMVGTTTKPIIKSININITLAPGQTIANLTRSQIDEITRVFAHELGHTFVSHFPSVTSKGLGIHGLEAADDITKIAARERKVVLQQIESNFNFTVNRMSKAQQVENGGTILEFRNFLRNPDEFLEELFTAVRKGEDFGGLDGQQAWQVFDRTLSEYSNGTNLLTSYQLWNQAEYFADWFSFMLLDPKRAALVSPNLNKAMAKNFPTFFTKISASKARQVIPDAVAASLRVDVPLASGVEALAPNLDSIGSVAVRFRSATQRVSNSTVQRQVSNVIRDNPSLHRKEFYSGLKVRYIDKIQTGRRSGSRRNLAFFDKGEFFINYDKWRVLPSQNQSAVLSDIISRHVWMTAKAPVKTRIRQEYADYLGRSIDFMANKADIQNLSRRPIEDIRDVVLGNKSKSIPRNLGFWGRNFDEIRPTIENVTDLPILNVESLRSPQAFWTEWFKTYTSNPGISSQYAPEFKDILEDFLRVGPLGKFLAIFKGGI